MRTESGAGFVAFENGEPIPMGALLNQILEAGGLPPVSRSVPPALAYMAGAAMEKAYGLLGKKEEHIMFRFPSRLQVRSRNR